MVEKVRVLEKARFESPFCCPLHVWALRKLPQISERPSSIKQRNESLHERTVGKIKWGHKYKTLTVGPDKKVISKCQLPRNTVASRRLRSTICISSAQQACEVVTTVPISRMGSSGTCPGSRAGVTAGRQWRPCLSVSVCVWSRQHTAHALSCAWRTSQGVTSMDRRTVLATAERDPCVKYTVLHWFGFGGRKAWPLGHQTLLKSWSFSFYLEDGCNREFGVIKSLSEKTPESPLPS